VCGYGTPHRGVAGSLCKYHGGLSPGGLAQAAKLKLSAELAARGPTFGKPVAVNALDALEYEVARSFAACAYLQQLVEQLDPATLVTDPESAGLLKLYMAERTAKVNACQAAIRCGVSERKLEIAEWQGRQFVQAMFGALNDPESALTYDGKERLRRVIARYVRALPIRSETGADVIDLPTHRDEGDDADAG
jgi:hypothetical protein